MVTTEEKSQSRRQFIRALSQGAGLGVLLSLAFGAGYFFKDYSPLRQTSGISLDLINEVDGILSEHYLYDLPSESVQIHGAAAGLVSSLAEPYTPQLLMSLPRVRPCTPMPSLRPKTPASRLSLRPKTPMPCSLRPWTPGV